MNTFEDFFLDLGLSWTISKILPYLIMVILGVISILITKRALRKLSFVIRILSKAILLVFPFGIYFLFAPIYQGDFSNDSIEVSKDAKYSELTGKKLVVVSMPGCPYCYQSIDRMKKLKERVPEAIIEYLVCLTTDSTTTEWYQEKGGTDIAVRLAFNSEAMTELANGMFPAFILVNADKPLKIWSNDSFGVAAMDEVELFLK